MASERRQRALYSIALAAVLLLAAFLRFYRLDASSLWSDEGNSWAMLGRSLREIADAAAADIHPPGYYWLLKGWAALFGDSAWAMRSFSAAAGVLLVLVVERVGRLILAGGRAGRWLALLGALLAAANPLLVYYSQEARMYMLLALLGAGVFWALLEMPLFQEAPPPSRKPPHLQEVAYVFVAALGLWTHYSFAIVLLAANLAWLGRWLLLRRAGAQHATGRALAGWFGLNLLALLLFLPWLPLALQSVLNWPKGGVAVGLGAGLEATLRTLVFGPLHTLPQPAWPWLALGAALPLLGLAGLLAAPHEGVRATRADPHEGVRATRADPHEGVRATRADPHEGVRATQADPHEGVRATQGAPHEGVRDVPGAAHEGVRDVSGAAHEGVRGRQWGGRFAWPLALWLGLPIVLMAGLGLFSDAFLKFLITAAPAWCLLAACAPLLGRRPALRLVLAGGVAAFALALALLLLPPYYRDAAARDNYQGVAAYLAAAGDPLTDLVILDAPGQQEVWRYYDPGLPVLALPGTRPPVAAEVESALAEATAGRRQVYALFWATDEADPGRLVEGWLDRNAFKSLDAWQGNLRLAVYALADRLATVPFAPVDFGAAIRLAGQAQPAQPQHLLPGEAALVQLRWLVLQDVDRRLKVSVQLLDAANQVVAQRDGEPQGGSRPTDGWRAGEQLLDNYALPLPLGTPPGDYRLVAALYDAQDGQRLRHAGGDMVDLGSVRVHRPAAPAPPGLLPAAQRLEQTLGPVTLLGYDAYRKDYGHAPQTPLGPGDTAHLIFYWQAPDPLPAGWPADLSVTLRLGEQSVTAPIGGPAYPTGAWQPGELVRSQMDIVFDGTDAQPLVEVAGETAALAPLPQRRP